MIKILMAVIALACLVTAQPAQVFFDDTTHYEAFQADSFFTGNAVSATSSGYNMITLLADDTASAGFSGDSIKIDFGIQYGLVVDNSSNRKDTAWLRYDRVGTISTLAADTAGMWIDPGVIYDTDSTTGDPEVAVGVMDSSSVTGFVISSQRFTTVAPYHIMRPWVSGATGCITGSYLRLRTQVTQLGYLPTRGK